MEIPRQPRSTRTAVFVHGAGGGGWEWAAWQRVFAAAGWDTLAPDLRPAPAGLAATTLGDYAAQVHGWVAPAARPRVLVGASLGGLLAAMHADAADALALVNPLPPSGLPAAAPPPAVVPWGRTASLAGTRRALPDADDLAALHAFRRWRDESGRVLAEARAGVAVATPRVPVLVIASEADDDVPPASSAALAAEWGTTLWRVPGSHVGPLLGRQAPALAASVLLWLNAAAGAAGIQHPLGAPA